MKRTRVAVVAAATAALLSPLAPADARPVTQSHWGVGADESGFVVDCTTVGSFRAGVSLYENTKKGNTYTVTLDGDGSAVVQTVLSERPFVTGAHVYARQALKEQVATVKGHFHIAGRREPYRETVVEDGFTVTTEGWHQRLRMHLRLAVDKQRAPLSCTAYAYWHKVSRLPVDPGQTGTK